MTDYSFIVDEANPSFADAPYTKQLGECGQPGEYIHMTEKFVTDEQYRENSFGDIGKLEILTKNTIFDQLFNILKRNTRKESLEIKTCCLCFASRLRIYVQFAILEPSVY